MTTHVLDTSALINTGKRLLYSFDSPDLVVVPIGVLRELEGLTKDSDLGWIARSVLRELELIRAQAKQTSDSTQSGVSLGDGKAKLRIEVNHKHTPDGFASSAHERSNVLLVTFNLKNEQNDEVVLVSNNLTQRVMAGSLGINASPITRSSLQGDYTGITTVTSTAQSAVPDLFEKKKLSLAEFELDKDVEENIVSNPKSHFYVVRNGDTSALAHYEDGAMRLHEGAGAHLPVKPRSVEQKAAVAHLMDLAKKVVSLGGPAGTGKTLLCLAVGMYFVNSKDSDINRVIVFRPMSKVGQEDIGFLPGTEAEKMEPWAENIKDALRVWMEPNAINREFEKGTIEVSPTSFIRGRTLDNAFVIIDEAQNYERLSILSLLSRLGANAKCALSWDAAQRDNLYVGKDDGIVSIVDRLKREDLFAHVTLSKSERSAAAELASNVLEELDL